MAPSKPQVIVITGCDSGFGYMTARSLALANHTVYAGLLRPRDTNAASYDECDAFSSDKGVALRGIQLDVTSDSSIKAAVDHIISSEGRIDVLIHNAGHMSLGPAESFSPDHYLHLFEINCLGCQRLNLAVLPHMRNQRSGLLIWVSSSSAHGPSSPFLAPYFAAKAAQDSLAQTYAVELTQFGIETSIIVPGVFVKGTNHFGSAGKPEYQDTETEYYDGPLKGWLDRCLKGSAEVVPGDADPQSVADEIVKVVATERGRRPFRVHVEADDGGAELVNSVRDKVRERFLRRIDCGGLLEVKID